MGSKPIMQMKEEVELIKMFLTKISKYTRYKVEANMSTAPSIDIRFYPKNDSRYLGGLVGQIELDPSFRKTFEFYGPTGRGVRVAPTKENVEKTSIYLKKVGLI